jgi:hypothetical protein
VRLQGQQDELFLDPERGGYFTSKQGDEFVIIRLKEDQVINLYLFFYFLPVLRIRDVYPGSRILIFTHPGSRISDPGSRIQKQQQKRGVKKNWMSYLFI